MRVRPIYPQELFKVAHNRYPINAQYDKHEIKEMWLHPAEHADQGSDDEDAAGSKPVTQSAFYNFVQEHQNDQQSEEADAEGANAKQDMRKLLTRGGTFHVRSHRQ